MFDFRKIFDLRKIFAVPKDFLNSKIYCTKFDDTNLKIGITVDVQNFILNKLLYIPPCDIYKLH